MIEKPENFMGMGEFVWWQGVVEDNNDPLKIGRCRVRVLGFHSPNKNEIPTAELPWASVIQPITSAAISGIGHSPTGLLQGTWVVGFFRDGKNCQEPIIMGSIAGIPIQASQPSIGFSDPSGTYPKSDLLNESDVNRLARNETITETIVQSKKDSRITSVQSAYSSETWDEPEVPYNATYPKNHTFSTESGHIQEFDDTPNQERIHRYHKSGTFEEIHPDGSVVRKIVSKNYDLVLEDNHIYIQGKKVENIDGDYDLKTGANLNIEVAGNVNLVVDGNTTMETKGDHFHRVTGVYQIVSLGNISFIAPRIDFNPEGFNASDIASPFGGGTNTLNIVTGISDFLGLGGGLF